MHRIRGADRRNDRHEGIMLETNGKIPLRWWDNKKNFGDLIGPWLAAKMTGREIYWAQKTEAHYLLVGSILDRVTPSSVVWGPGSFGTEGRKVLKKQPKYLAVRGPLTRSKLVMHDIDCPRVYGDPALLVPDYYLPEVRKTHRLGVVLRWSEGARKKALEARGIKVIDLLTDQVEETIDAFLSCERIITTSLHGLIIADTYRIPNAWLIADTGAGKEYKFWDYLISVGKCRPPVDVDIKLPYWTEQRMLREFDFDDRRIGIDLDLLRSTCPLLHRTPEIEEAEARALEAGTASPEIVDQPRASLARRKKAAATPASAAPAEPAAQPQQGVAGWLSGRLRRSG